MKRKTKPKVKVKVEIKKNKKIKKNLKKLSRKGGSVKKETAVGKRKKSILGSLEKRGYFSLQILSGKYGYTKDHIGWLSRTGQIEAIRHGKYGQWHVKGNSLKSYISSIASENEKRLQLKKIAYSSIRKSFTPTLNDLGPNNNFKAPQKSPTQDISIRQPAESVLFDLVLSNEENKSSSSAEEEVTKRINAALTASLVLGGFLLLSLFFPSSINLAKKGIQSAFRPVKQAIAYLADKLLPDLFYPEPVFVQVPSPSRIIEVEKVTERVITEKITKEITITRNLDEEELNSILSELTLANARIDGLKSEIQSLEQPIIISRTLRLPSTNTKGIPTVFINPQKIETEELTVTSTGTIEVLSVIQDLTVDTNTFYVDSANNRVGIGTASPTTTLDVNGAANISGALTVSGTLTATTIDFNTASAQYFYAQPGTAASPSFAFDLDKDTGIFRPALNQLAFSTLGIERLRIDSNGNVGIGTTSPITTFQVQGTASASYLLTGNTLQVGGYASVAYSRFGTATTTHALSASNDLLISGNLEIDGSVFFDGASISFGSGA